MSIEETFLNALGTFAEIAKSADLDAALVGEARESATRIRGFRILVPVVGSFNAGKTSLINAYLGRGAGQGLPTDIVPQTALATEIHPARDGEPESVELCDGSDRVLDRLDLREFGRFEKQAVLDPREDAEYARAHLETEALADGSPVILVDMPGLDSGLRNHNTAIQRYLPLGSHFMLVVDIERGSLRESEVVQLREFLERDVEFTVLANKADRKRTERDEVVGHIARQVADIFGKQAVVHAVSARTGEIAPFAEAFAAIDPDAALGKYWRQPLLRLFDTAITSLHTRYSAINVSSGEAESVVEDLERKRRDLEAKLADDEQEIRGRYSERATDRIVRDVRDGIRASANSLAAAYESGGTTAFEQNLNELVRSALNRALRSAGSETQREIAERYRANVEGLDAELRRLVGNTPDAADTSVGHPPRAFDHAAEVSSRAFTDATRQFRATNWKSLASIGAGIFGILTSVVPVLLEAVLVLVPWVLDLFGSEQRREEQEQQRRAQLRAQIANVVAPKVASEIRGPVEEQLSKVTGELLSSLRADMQEQIERVQADIRKSRSEIEAGQQEAEARRGQLAADVRKLTDAKGTVENA